jgi:dTDP-4-amino-4,6-dideoxygalactose transaminase
MLRGPVQGEMREIPLFKAFLADDVLARLSSTFGSGHIGQGSRVADFENALSSYLNAPHVVTTNSGTSALHLALHLLRRPRGDWPGLNDGDEVLTTPLTCVASNWPILANRLTPHWCDVGESDLTIDVRSVAAALSPRTKVVMVVHWGGHPVDLAALDDVLDAASPELGFRPMVVEDCAHALGSTFGGRKIGSHGNLCAFSFQGVKTLTCGDGGALCVSDPATHRRATLLRWYGLDLDVRDVVEWGFKFHMNDINATIGLANLPHVDWILQRQRNHAAFYDAQLGSCGGIARLSGVRDQESSRYLYSVRVEKREDFKKWLREGGIEVRQVYSRNDLYTCVEEWRRPLPSLDAIDGEIVCLPVGWWLTNEDLEAILSRIRMGW